VAGFSTSNPNFPEIAFFDGYLHKLGIAEFSFQATDQLVCSVCMAILVISEF
jgi:hypothetical protein